MLMTLFVQVSGYTFLQGVTEGATAQHGASPGYAKSGVCGYVVHPEKRGTLERHREKSPQKWRPLLRANAVPMVREGKSVAICRFVPGRRMKRSRGGCRRTKR